MYPTRRAATARACTLRCTDRRSDEGSHARLAVDDRRVRVAILGLDDHCRQVHSPPASGDPDSGAQVRRRKGTRQIGDRRLPRPRTIHPLRARALTQPALVPQLPGSQSFGERVRATTMPRDSSSSTRGTPGTMRPLRLKTPSNSVVVTDRRLVRLECIGVLVYVSPGPQVLLDAVVLVQRDEFVDCDRPVIILWHGAFPSFDGGRPPGSDASERQEG